MPRVTLQKSAQGQPGTLRTSVNLKRFDSIVGAARMETAMVPKKGTDQILVNTEEVDQKEAHSFSRERVQ